MGLFDKLKKDSSNKSSQTFQTQMFTGVYPIERSNFRDVFSACLGRMIHVQRAFDQVVVRGQDMDADFSFGKLKIGEAEYPIQFIGTESALNGTWRWGWDNVNGFDESVLKLAAETRAKGEAWGLAPFTDNNFAVGGAVTGQSLAVAACGISAENYALFRYVYEDGIAFAAVSGLPAAVFAQEDVDRFATNVMRGIQRYDVDHKVFLESYLRWNGTPYEWDGRYLTAHFSLDLVVTFENKDGLMRIAGMKTNRKL